MPITEPRQSQDMTLLEYATERYRVEFLGNRWPATVTFKDHGAPPSSFRSPSAHVNELDATDDPAQQPLSLLRKALANDGVTGSSDDPVQQLLSLLSKALDKDGAPGSPGVNSDDCSNNNEGPSTEHPSTNRSAGRTASWRFDRSIGSPSGTLTRNGVSYCWCEKCSRAGKWVEHETNEHHGPISPANKHSKSSPQGNVASLSFDPAAWHVDTCFEGDTSFEGDPSSW